MSRYTVLGLVAAFVGTAVVVVVGSVAGMAERTVLTAVLAPLCGFPVGVKLAHIVYGREMVVLYEQVVWALAVTALALWLQGEPLAGIDLTMIGLSAFLVFGRLGCLTVGCCHGQPARRGIRYGQAHAQRGFPSHLVGIPLFPLQAIEAVLHLALGVVAVAWLLSGHVTGEVVALYLSCYALARFGLELMRGDEMRPHLRGMSEAQWLSVAIVWAALGFGLARAPALVPLYGSCAALVSVGAWILVRYAPRLSDSRWGLRKPHRIHQLADALDQLDRSHRSSLDPVELPWGLRITHSRSVREDGGATDHYGLSHRHIPLESRAATELARQLAILRRLKGQPRLIAGTQAGVFHAFLDHPAQEANLVGRSTASVRTR